MIIVTGAAGFIGSNIIAGLNARGIDDILAVDNLSEGVKMRNLADLRIADYQDQDDFLDDIQSGKDLGNVTAISHQGACSATTEWDGRYMMRNNYEYSKTLLHWCLERGVQYHYASSASVYGPGPVFKEGLEHEKPINMYAYSKFLFDQYVRRMGAMNSQVVGLRYFNVYGPREQHKGSMSSVAFHFDQQIRDNGECKLFAGSDGYGDGEQRRDFVYVGDVADVNLWLLDNPDVSGVFNLGTGRSQSFNDVANAVVDWHGKGKLNYVPFPDHLKGSYQSFTEADMSALRAAGYEAPFKSVEEGVKAYMDFLHAND